MKQFIYWILQFIYWVFVCVNFVVAVFMLFGAFSIQMRGIALPLAIVAGYNTLVYVSHWPYAKDTLNDLARTLTNSAAE